MTVWPGRKGKLNPLFNISDLRSLNLPYNASSLEQRIVPAPRCQVLHRGFPVPLYRCRPALSSSWPAGAVMVLRFVIRVARCSTSSATGWCYSLVRASVVWGFVWLLLGCCFFTGGWSEQVSGAECSVDGRHQRWRRGSRPGWAARWAAESQ